MRIIRQSAWRPAGTRVYDTAAEKRRAFAAHVRRDVRARRQQDMGGHGRAAGAIIRAVRAGGDMSIYRYEKKFGGLQSADVPLRLSPDEIRAAYDAVLPLQYDAICRAAGRLAATEKKTMGAICRDITVRHGGPDTRGRDAAVITRRFVPLHSVGCYVPGGGARYPSSAIMSVTPAAIAGVPRIAVVSPVTRGQDVPDPLTIVAADMCGATEIYRIGGAQAVAALAYGTESMLAVDKIVGPGGPYVTAAKSAVSADVGIDMLAGPTELGIVADSQAPVRLAALDLISQAEHSPDAQCYMITTSERIAARVDTAVSRMVSALQYRRGIVSESMSHNAFIVIADDTDSAICVADALAPEHLQIMTSDPSRVAQKLTAPGMMLLGADTPSAASDYLLGSNHVLPTGGSGAVRGSLSVLDFVKMTTTAEAAAGALADIDGDMGELARAEGLYNHYEAVGGRLGRKNGGARTAKKTGGRGAK